jgi:hypothetical protein
MWLSPYDQFVTSKFVFWVHPEVSSGIFKLLRGQRGNRVIGRLPTQRQGDRGIRYVLLGNSIDRTSSACTYLAPKRALSQNRNQLESGHMTRLSNTAEKWRKSSFSQNGDCVEVTFSGGKILARDSKRPDERVLVFTFSEWSTFVAGVRGDKSGQP